MGITRKDLIRKWRQVDKRLEEAAILLKWLADAYEKKPEKKQAVQRMADMLEEFYLAVHKYWRTYC